MSAQRLNRTSSTAAVPDRDYRAAGADTRRRQAASAQREDKSARSNSISAGKLKNAAIVSHHLVWITVGLLLITGLCMMLSISVASAVSGGDKFMYIRQQGVTAVIGLVLLIIASRVNYRKIRALSIIFLVGVLFSLLLLHVPGMSRSSGGSSSWLPLGPLTFQPSEFAKLAVVLAGAHLLSNRRRSGGGFWYYMWPFGTIGLGASALVVLEHDLGTAIILAGLTLGLLWLGGMKGSQWGLVAGTSMVAAVGLTFSNKERMARVLSFLNPSADPQRSSYQLSQSLVALGRGGWFGVGPGDSIQKFQYLPKAQTDMVFAILGEEFGLVGAVLVILLFALFAIACWRLARRCSDPMGRYLIAGCGMLVTLQAIVNLGGVTGALPLTGVPLPFISYGRNSLLVMLVAVGLILAVSRSASARPARSIAEANGNVTHIDRRRRNRWSRGARPSTS